MGLKSVGYDMEWQAIFSYYLDGLLAEEINVVY